MTSRRVKVTFNGKQAQQRAHAAAGRGLEKAMEHGLTESRKEVPIEETTLERSGTAVVDTDNLIGAVSYDTSYAVRQHEELGWQHDEGRKAKYLEDPWAREGRTMLALVAAEVRRELR